MASDKKIEDALRKLAMRAKGELTAEVVVQVASDPKSILHPLFTWDNRTAAHKWRLDEARTLIRRFETTITAGRHVVMRVPVFIRDPEKAPGEQGYKLLSSFRSGSDNAKQVLLNEFERISAALMRARAVAAAMNMEPEIDELIDMICQRTREAEHA